MKIKGDFVIREIAGECIAVPVGATAHDFNGMITLNEASKFIWNQIESGASQEEMLKAVLEEFDVSEEDAASDIEAFISKMEKEGLVERN